MFNKDNICLKITAAIIGLLMLFPPFAHIIRNSPRGHYFIFSGAGNHYEVDITLLLTMIFAVLAVGILLHFATKKRG